MSAMYCEHCHKLVDMDSDDTHFNDDGQCIEELSQADYTMECDHDDDDFISLELNYAFDEIEISIIEVGGTSNRVMLSKKKLEKLRDYININLELMYL